VRAAAAEGLAFLGVALDPAADAAADGRADAEVGARGAPVRVLVMVAREDLEVARQTRRVLFRTGRSRVQGIPRICR
jgi:acetate kinase